MAIRRPQSNAGFCWEFPLAEPIRSRCQRIFVRETSHSEAIRKVIRGQFDGVTELECHDRGIQEASLFVLDSPSEQFSDWLAGGEDWDRAVLAVADRAVGVDAEHFVDAGEQIARAERTVFRCGTGGIR